MHCPVECPDVFQVDVTACWPAAGQQFLLVAVPLGAIISINILAILKVPFTHLPGSKDVPI